MGNFTIGLICLALGIIIGVVLGYMSLINGIEAEGYKVICDRANPVGDGRYTLVDVRSKMKGRRKHV